MKVTYNWLKDFVEIKIPAGKLAEKLTMAGLEVVSLEEKEGDFVFEIEVTSNRPDWLSVAGIAREVAAVTNSKMRAYNIEPIAHSKCRLSAKRYPLNAKTLTIDIEIQDKKDCPLYIARIIRDLKVGPSPAWLKKRLELIGCRSINNAVDITNYLLFELGEPLHAFDLDKVVSRLTGEPVGLLNVIIRRAKKGEEIITIDDAKIILDEQILVIASEANPPLDFARGRQTRPSTSLGAGKPIAIAGVMGGKDTEVTESTTNILLEAAVFNPITVRQAGRRLGLQSESAYRFERGIDGEIVECASRRAAQLLTQLAGGECVLAKSYGKPNLKKNKVTLNLPQSNKILGASITAAAAKKILSGLGLKAAAKGKNDIKVEIPSRRGDLKAQIDLTEELARIYGFGKIPMSLPSLRAGIIPDKNRELVAAVKNILAGLGLNEVITYSLVDKPLLRKEAIGILNPLSREQEFLRPQIIPSLVACISRNLNYKQEHVNIFEAAKVFCPAATGVQEELMLGIALCGTRPYISEQGALREKFGLLHLKGVLEALIERMGVATCGFAPLEKTTRGGSSLAGFTQEGTSLIGIYAGADKIGEMLCLEKGFLDKLEIKNREVAAAELSLEKLFSHLKLTKTFMPLPKYPGITRDISLALREDTPIAKVAQAAKDAGRPLLRKIEVTDYYKGKQIPDGEIGLTLSCFYHSDQRTLTEPEVNHVHNLICSLLAENFSARLR